MSNTPEAYKQEMDRWVAYFDRLGQFHQDNHALIFCFLNALYNMNIIADFRQTAHTIKVLPYTGPH